MSDQNYITPLAQILRTAGYSSPNMSKDETVRQNDMIRGLVADAKDAADSVRRECDIYRTALAFQNIVLPDLERLFVMACDIERFG